MKNTIGDDFQQETKYRRDGIPGGGMRGPSPEVYKTYPDAEAAPLPRGGDMPEARLFEVLARRRSVRRFSTAPVSLEQLSMLLWSFNGVTADMGRYQFRTAPSAGALYPVETYCVSNNVDGLAPGVYHHNIPAWRLELVRGGAQGRNMADACMRQRMCEAAAVVFAWTAVVERCKWKYLQRAYRYMYLDAGHAGAHLHLAAEALGMGCCMIGAFFDDEVNAVLGVDGDEETILYVAAVGAI